MLKQFYLSIVNISGTVTDASPEMSDKERRSWEINGKCYNLLAKLIFNEL